MKGVCVQYTERACYPHSLPARAPSCPSAVLDLPPPSHWELLYFLLLLLLLFHVILFHPSVLLLFYFCLSPG